MTMAVDLHCTIVVAPLRLKFINTSFILPLLVSSIPKLQSRRVLFRFEKASNDVVPPPTALLTTMTLLSLVHPTNLVQG
jgi:hypothetical protein